jgi:hypothetical protein
LIGDLSVVIPTETVRFSEALKLVGKLETYLPFGDPKSDKDFMRAVREHRVLSLKQEPKGTKKDFGTVGFLPERYVSYLIFPKSLTAFSSKRVVGIKYDAVSEAGVSTNRSSTAPSSRSLKPARPKPEPKPRPKRFTATVRLISANDVRVTVEAFDEKEACEKAKEAARKRRDSQSSLVETELLSLNKGEST